MPRYRTLNNDPAINVDGVRVFADLDGWFYAAPGSRLQQVLMNGGAVLETYTGEPVYVLGQSAVAQTVTPGSTAEEVLAQILVPAGAMGLNGALRVSTLWTVNNNANAKEVRYRLGATALGGSAWWANTTFLASVVTGMPPPNTLRNRGAANSQLAYPTSNGGLTTSANTSIATFAEDTSQPLILAITGKKANGADTLTLEGWTVELLRP